MNEYRRLEKGELIEAGDEADASRKWNDDLKWRPVNPSSIGKPASDPKYPAHTQYRRPLGKATGEENIKPVMST